MAIERTTVRGPDFAKKVQDAQATVEKLEQNNWDFSSEPNVFAESNNADVIGKELAIVHDGSQQTIFGNLIIGGVGTEFNLMGPMESDAEFKVKPNNLIEDINRTLGSSGLADFDQYKALPQPMEVDFFNYTNFYSLKDLIFWHLLHGSGCFPSAVELMRKDIALGKWVQNSMYRPAVPSKDVEHPAIMAARCMMKSHATPNIEWMDKPIFGGLYEETLHVEYLLTPKKSDAAHPYLKQDRETTFDWNGHRWHLKRFSGITPKEGLRGAGISDEQK